MIIPNNNFLNKIESITLTGAYVMRLALCAMLPDYSLKYKLID
jgi:hypothetical protein